jgi:hypothetical protein
MHDRTVLWRSWLEFGFWRDFQRGEISRRFGLNIFDTGQFRLHRICVDHLTLWRVFRDTDRNWKLAPAARLPVHAPLTEGGTR